jgi:hypothetical protein
MLQSQIALLRLSRYFEAVDDWNFAFWLNRNKIRLLVGESGPVAQRLEQGTHNLVFAPRDKFTPSHSCEHE